MLALAAGGMARTLQRAAREQFASTQLRTAASDTGMRAIQGPPGTACAGSVRPAAARLLFGLREGPQIRPCASPGLPCGRCSSMAGPTETPNHRAELLMGQCGGLAAGSRRAVRESAASNAACECFWQMSRAAGAKEAAQAGHGQTVALKATLGMSRER